MLPLILDSTPHPKSMGAFVTDFFITKVLSTIPKLNVGRRDKTRETKTLSTCTKYNPVTAVCSKMRFSEMQNIDQSTVLTKDRPTRQVTLELPVI